MLAATSSARPTYLRQPDSRESMQDESANLQQNYGGTCTLRNVLPAKLMITLSLYLPLSCYPCALTELELSSTYGYVHTLHLKKNNVNSSMQKQEGQKH